MKSVNLDEVAEVLYGYAFDSERFGDEGDLPLVRIRDVVRGRSNTYYSGEYDPRYIVDDGDLLIGMDGEFNRERWSGGRALLNQRVCRIKALDPRLDESYLYWFLPEALKEIERQTPFVTVKHLSAKQIKAITLPLPPIEEQRRIASILDSADALRSKRRQALEKLDSLTQSIFIDMFGDPIANDRSWPERTLRDVCQRIQIGPFGSLLHQSDYEEGGIPIVNPMHIVDGTIRARSDQTVPLTKHAELANYQLRQGDVVMGRRGEMGRCAVVGPAEDGWLCGSGSLFFRPDLTQLTPLFLAAALSSPRGRDRLERLAQGVTMLNLNSDMVESFVLGLPPVDSQARFVAATTRWSELAASCRQSLSRLDALFSSLQYRAIRGEL